MNEWCLVTQKIALLKANSYCQEKLLNGILWDNNKSISLVIRF